MPDQFQYVRLPDGSYGKFAANATDAQIRAQIAKNFTSIPAKTQPADTFKLMSEKPPENARFPALGRTGYKAADFLLNLLPGAGAAVGGMQVETGPGAAAAAALGGMGGERAQRYLQDLLYKDLPSQTAREALTSMGTQGILGATQEFGGRALSAPLRALMKPFARSAETVAGAEAGRGVRMTPGEATNNKMMKIAEGVLEHWPGGAGPMETFREAQTADINRLIDDQLKAISQQNLPREQVAEQVQTLFRDTEQRTGEQAKDAYNQAYARVKKTLGLPSDATKDEIDAAIGRREHPGSVYDPYLKQKFKLPGRSVEVERAQLAEAKRLYQAEIARTPTRLAQRIINTNDPALISGFFTKAGSKQLAAFRAMPEPLRQNAARSILEDFITPARDVKTGELDPAAVARSLDQQLKKLGQSRGRIIFGDQYDDIIEANDLLKRIGMGETGPTGKMHMAKFLGTLGATLGGGIFIGHPVAGAVTAGSEYLGPKILSFMLTNPQFSETTLKILRGAAVSAARGIPQNLANEVFQTSPAAYPLPRLEAPTQ